MLNRSINEMGRSLKTSKPAMWLGRGQKNRLILCHMRKNVAQGKQSQRRRYAKQRDHVVMN